FSVSQRTHEIGIRMALGARPSDILKIVLRRAAILTLFGIVVGLAASIVLTRLMTNLLYTVSGTDVPTFAAISGLLVVVSILASYIPGGRAMKVSPVEALRTE